MKRQVNEIMSNETYSEIFGWLSIFCWAVVFTPQIYKNYVNKNGESVSLPFLWIWLVGDIFNVAGIVVEKLLPTMLYLGIYYAIADILLIIQVYYYRYKSGENVMEEDDENDPLIPRFRHNHEPVRSSRMKTVTIFSMCLWIYFPASIVWFIYFGFTSFLGWSSALFYIGSRVPQIWKNHNSVSLEGLSLPMFIFGMFGNIFFCASILAASTESDYILVNLPWLVGSAGTLIFDFLIGIQILISMP